MFNWMNSENKVQSMTFDECRKHVINMRKGLFALGVAQPNGKFGETYKFFGQMSKNRWEMSAMDIASICQGFTQVPLYDTLGKEAVEWILSQTELDVV